jgi:hypothetical protein
MRVGIDPLLTDALVQPAPTPNVSARVIGNIGLSKRYRRDHVNYRLNAHLQTTPD